MKYTTLIAAVCLLLSLQLKAQIGNLTLGGNAYAPSAFNIKLGVEGDYYSNISPEWMKNHTKDPSQIEFDDSGFETVSHAEVAGLSIGGHLMFTNPGNLDGRKHKYREIKLGVDVIVAGEALVTFTETDERMDSTYVTSRMYCLVNSEFRLGGEYRFRTSWGRFNTFFGVGSHIGATFNDKMLLFKGNSVAENGAVDEEEFVAPDMDEMDVETYAAKSSIYMRAYVPLGISFRTCRRLELGLEQRWGIGVGQVIDGDTYFMKHVGFTSLTLTYHFDDYFKYKKSVVPDYR